MTSRSTNQNPSSHSATSKTLLNPANSLQMFEPLALNVPNPILYGADTIFNANFVERELECQICLSPLESPVLLACNSHSLCLSCMTSLYKHQKKQKDGSRAIFCPSCGLLSGMMKVKKPEHFKVNKELERVQKAYEKEKSMWIEEKVKLETQLTNLNSTQVEETPLKKEKGKAASKKGLSASDEKSLKAMLEGFGPEKLKEANQMILDYIKGEEKDLVTPVKRVTRRAKNKEEEHDDSAKTTPSLNGGSTTKKSTSQRGLWFYLGKSVKHNTTDNIKRENTVDVDTLEKREYPLRSLKRTRTNQF